MPITVPPAGTAIREMSRTIEESEGHLLEFAASFVTLERSTSRAKFTRFVSAFARLDKYLRGNDLAGYRGDAEREARANVR
jgi:hypothetical protein